MEPVLSQSISAACARPKYPEVKGMTWVFKSSGRWKQEEEASSIDLTSAGMGLVGIWSKGQLQPWGAGNALEGEKGAECGRAARSRAGVGGSRIVIGLLCFSAFIPQMSLMLDVFVMCFLRILDDNPIARISQRLFTGLKSLFFL